MQDKIFLVAMGLIFSIFLTFSKNSGIRSVFAWIYFLALIAAVVN